MNDKTAARAHGSFWVISVLTLIWNVLGVIKFFAQMSPDALALYRESERAIVQDRPAWATAGFAAAVFGGAAGGMLLVLRSLPRRFNILHLQFSTIYSTLVAS